MSEEFVLQESEDVDINPNDGDFIISGLGSFGSLSVLDISSVANVYSTGVITATTFSGNATSSTYATNAGISTYASTAGIATISQGLTGTPNINVGVVTVQQLIVSGISTVGLGTTSTPPSNSQMSFELTSNTNLRIKVRGTDGILRFANITLA
jgi:hypothetical protein